MASIGMGRTGRVDDERGAGGGFPQGVFAPMLFFTKVLSVIAPKNNDGVFCMFARILRRHKAAAPGVQVTNGCEITLYCPWPLVVL